MNINLEIAERKGLEMVQMHEGKVRYCLYHHPSADHADVWGYVDYQNDPALILELQMELMNKGYFPKSSGFGLAYWWEHNSDETTKDLKFWDKHNLPNNISHFGTATCLAYLEAFK